MKKMITAFFVMFAVFTIAACNKKEYAHDGDFTAYEVTASNGAPQVTSVTVTIEKGKIAKYNIDVRQGSVDRDNDEKITGVAWNAKTKKELGDDYGMKGVGPKYEFKDGKWSVVEGAKSEKEWFEQAALIEAKWLKDGHESITKTDDRIDNVAGVTLKDGGYTKLASEAVANAKAGKMVAFEVGISSNAAQVTEAVLTLEKGKAKSLVIDTRQSKISPTEGNVWNVKTKQELGNDYGMKDVGPKYEFKDGAWSIVAGAKADKEWFEQVNTLAAYVLANYNKSLKPIAGRGGTLDGTTLIDELATVTSNTGTYFNVIHAAYKAAKLA